MCAWENCFLFPIQVVYLPAVAVILEAPSRRQLLHTHDATTLSWPFKLCRSTSRTVDFFEPGTVQEWRTVLQLLPFFTTPVLFWCLREPLLRRFYYIRMSVIQKSASWWSVSSQTCCISVSPIETGVSALFSLVPSDWYRMASPGLSHFRVLRPFRLVSKSKFPYSSDRVWVW